MNEVELLARQPENKGRVDCTTLLEQLKLMQIRSLEVIKSLAPEHLHQHGSLILWPKQNLNRSIGTSTIRCITAVKLGIKKSGGRACLFRITQTLNTSKTNNHNIIEYVGRRACT